MTNLERIKDRLNDSSDGKWIKHYDKENRVFELHSRLETGGLAWLAAHFDEPDLDFIIECHNLLPVFIEVVEVASEVSKSCVGWRIGNGKIREMIDELDKKLAKLYEVTE